MRIWWFNQFAVPPTAAGGTRHWSLARGLGASGHDVTLFASATNYMERRRAPLAGLQCVEGVRFAFVPAWRPGDGSLARVAEMAAFAWRARAEGLRLARRQAPDLIIGSTPSPLAARAALSLSRRLAVPFVLEVRDIWPESLLQLGRFGPGHPWIRVLALLQRQLMAGARGIVSVLPQAGAYYAGFGFDAERVCLVPNGVDLGLAPAPTPAPDARPFTVSYAGAHGVANDLDTALDAAALLRDAGEQDLRFEFIGDGPERARLEARAANEKLDSVHFRGAVPKARVYGELARAQVLLMPLRRADVFAHGVSPNKLWDYFAAARPVLFAVAAGNNPVTEQDAGIALAPESPQALAEAVLALRSASPDARRAMGQRGRAFVEREHDNRMLAQRLARFLEAVR